MGGFFFSYPSHSIPNEMSIVGTMDSGSVLLVNRPSPRAPMGPGPKANRSRTVNRPRNARATFHPGASYPRRLLSRYALVLRCLITRMLPFPIDDFTKRNCQLALHDISIYSLKNQSPCLQRNRKAFPTGASRESGYIKRRTSHPSRNESHILLPLWEEIFHSP